VTKDTIRREVWDTMKRQRVALFPGADGRIPNFKGARQAAERLANTAEFQNAKILKCNPDAPQLPVRALALAAGKTVLMAVPRLREEKCFIKVTDPRGASIAGATRYGVPVHPKDMPRVDLIVAGCVAVNELGQRIGKGGGYSDLEFALGVYFGFVTDQTVIATTVHDIQVVDDNLPVLAHDIPVDLVATPTRLLRTPHPPRPEGIDWTIAPNDIPILLAIRDGARKRRKRH
jgi:5-formyltetrahydrofolate cyclo-ligase